MDADGYADDPGTDHRSDHRRDSVTDWGTHRGTDGGTDRCSGPGSDHCPDHCSGPGSERYTDHLPCCPPADERGVRAHPALRSTITSRGQITVPVWLRRRLGLRPGDRVRFEEYDVGFVFSREGSSACLVDWTAYLGKNCPVDHAVRALRGDSGADPPAETAAWW